MLKKINRLCRDKDFKNIFEVGRSSFGPLLGVKSAKNDLGYSRIGIIVGSKVSKKAVERNLIKRRLRSVLRQELISIKPGYDLAIVALPAIIKADFADLKSAVIANLRRLRVLNKE